MTSVLNDIFFPTYHSVGEDLWMPEWASGKTGASLVSEIMWMHRLISLFVTIGGGWFDVECEGTYQQDEESHQISKGIWEQTIN